MGSIDGVGMLMQTLSEHPDAEVRQMAALILTSAGPDVGPIAEALAQAAGRPNEESATVAEAFGSLKALEGQGHRESFCLVCRSNRRIEDQHRVTLTNGNLATIGNCPTCGKTVFRLGDSQS